jgi:hypothetical protein
LSEDNHFHEHTDTNIADKCHLVNVIWSVKLNCGIFAKDDNSTCACSQQFYWQSFWCWQQAVIINQTVSSLILSGFSVTSLLLSIFNPLTLNVLSLDPNLSGHFLSTTYMHITRFKTDCVVTTVIGHFDGLSSCYAWIFYLSFELLRNAVSKINFYDNGKNDFLSF